MPRLTRLTRLTPEKLLTLISLTFALISLAEKLHHHAAALKRKRRVHSVIGFHKHPAEAVRPKTAKLR